MEQHPEEFKYPEEKEAEAREMPVYKRITAAVIINRWLSKLEDWLNIGGVTLIILIMLLTVVGAGARYFFDWPVPGEVDITEISMAGIVFLGLAFTLRVGGHVRVEFIVNMFRGRYYHLIEFGTLLLALFLFVVVFISSLQFTLNSWMVGDVTPELLLPIWPAKLCVTIGTFLICLRLIIRLAQHLSRGIAGVERKDL
jgi:TRAP-type C4-dicarboxylate transport system permease small subunit